MKLCPDCRREYVDDTLVFCLDDGARLLDGPASFEGPATALLPGAEPEPETKILSAPSGGSDAPPVTKGNRNVQALLALGGIVLLAAAAVWAVFFREGSTVKQIRSVAVMPFANDSGNPDLEYLSDGMAETLINNLSQLPNLNVKSRSSVFRYKGREADTQFLAKELGVDAILNGRVLQRGQQISLSLELVDAATGNTIWGDKYNRNTPDLVELQNEIARVVSRKLSTKLSGADGSALAKSYTQNSEAYQLYLRGRYYEVRRTREDLNKSIDYYQRALAIDPTYPLPLTGLADAYLLQADYGHASPHESYPKAKEVVTRALSIDKDLGEAHDILCAILTNYEYDFAGAERACKLALGLNPNDDSAHHTYGLLLTKLGRHEEALAEFRRGLDIEPLSLNLNKNYGEALFYARRYEEALAQLNKTIELDPSYAPAHASLYPVYQTLGRHAEAVEEYARFEELFDRRENAKHAREIFTQEGWRGFAQRMDGRSTSFSSSTYTHAIFNIVLGDHDKAIVALHRAYEGRVYRFAHAKVDPRLDPLRNDTRFQELLRKAGFPK